MTEIIELSINLFLLSIVYFIVFFMHLIFYITRDLFFFPPVPFCNADISNATDATTISPEVYDVSLFQYNASFIARLYYAARCSPISFLSSCQLYFVIIYNLIVHNVRDRMKMKIWNFTKHESSLDNFVTKFILFEQKNK